MDARSKKLSYLLSVFSSLLLFCLAFWLYSSLGGGKLDQVIPATTKEEDRFDVQIVYSTFVNLKRPDWLHVISLQLNNLVSNGLAQRASQIYVCISTEMANSSSMETAKVLRRAQQHITNILPNARIEATLANKYEFPGIRKVWDLSQRLSGREARETIFLYFHSKGMFNSPDKSSSRDFHERMLFRTVIDPWKSILPRFVQHETLNKAGYAASSAGFIWYNFWWVRASYAQNLVCPIVSKRRHYYEVWLALLDSNLKHWPKMHAINFEIANQELANFTRARDLVVGAGPSDCLSLCKDGVPLGMYWEWDKLCE